MRHSPTDIENLRRSAAMAPLPQATVLELLDGYFEMAKGHEQIAGLVQQLPTDWGAMEKLLRIVTGSGRDASRDPAPERL